MKHAHLFFALCIAATQCIPHAFADGDSSRKRERRAVCRSQDGLLAVQMEKAIRNNLSTSLGADAKFKVSVSLKNIERPQKVAADSLYNGVFDSAFVLETAKSPATGAVSATVKSFDDSKIPAELSPCSIKKKLQISVKVRGADEDSDTRSSFSKEIVVPGIMMIEGGSSHGEDRKSSDKKDKYKDSKDKKSKDKSKR
jgi:hypothetical protein